MSTGKARDADNVTDDDHTADEEDWEAPAIPVTPPIPMAMPPAMSGGAGPSSSADTGEGTIASRVAARRRGER